MLRFYKSFFFFAGLIFYSFGNCQAWVQDTTLTNSDIQDISFYNSTKGWMVGNNGFFAKYENSSWQVIPTPTASHFVTIQPIDSNKVWLASKSKIYLYDNGLFTDFTPSGNLYINDIYMLDSTGWCLNNNKILFFKNNQWIDTTSSPTNGSAYDIDFFDTNGYIVGNFPITLNSSNGFQDTTYSWTSYTTCIKVISSTDYFISRTHNIQGSGHQWMLHFPGNDTLYYTPNPNWTHDIDMINNSGWAVDGSGKIFKFDSIDYKFLVHQMWPYYLNTVEMTSDTTGWIGGENGLLLKLSNLGLFFNENEISNYFEIFPNLVETSISFQTLNYEEQIQIFDLNGKLSLKTKLTPNTQHTINVSNFKPGSYICIISGSNTVRKSKFIKTD